MAKTKTAKLEAEIVRINAVAAFAATESKTRIDKVEGDRARAVISAQENEKRLITSEDNVATLKELLLQSENENARLRGYIGRVNEQDDATSEVVASEPPRTMPATKLARLAAFDGRLSNVLEGYVHGTSDRSKPKHWTSL